MNKYLIEILKIQNSVILPGLGALMVPSQKTGKIVFNPHLKFNDGSLARFIADKEGIDEQEAQNKVAKFVREIEAEIGKGNSYDMFEFGKFFKNKDGEVDFTMYSGDDKTTATVAKPDPKPEKKVTVPVAEKAETPEIKKEAPKKVEKKPAAKKPATKKTTKKSKESTEKTTKATDDTKQSKNKFIPPVVEEVKEDLTEKVKAVEEKIEDKVEKVKDKIEEKAESVEKGVAGIIAETEEKVEEKVEAIKEKVEEKIEEVKEKITGKEDKKTVIAAADATKSKTDDKQSKNTFVPPVESDAKAEDSNKSKGAVATTVAAGAAVVTGTVAAASTGSKTVVEKTKETTIIKETVVKEEKKKRRIWPWIILLLLLIGIAVTGYFFKDKIMEFFNDGEAVVADSTAIGDSTENGLTTIPVEIPDSLIYESNDLTDSSGTDLDSMSNPVDETDPIEDPIEDPVDEVAPVVSGTNNGSFHLIGNSFGEEANAERYVQKMQDKGYPAKVLGRFDGLYMVSLKSYDSNEAAKEGRSSVSADAGSAWVFKYPK
ncbi:MAG: hypothetical protein ACI8ZM_002692 [Crocinitomix sp.]|jgi:hypothetical protein